MSSPYRAGFAVLLGEPNIGKSTLINALTGYQVAIVSPKPQTTRRRASGIISNDAFQIIFIDAPGWIDRSVGNLSEFIKSEVESTLESADVLIFCLGPDSELNRTESLWQKVKASKKPYVVFALQADQKDWIGISSSLKYIQEQGADVNFVSVKSDATRTKNAVLEKIVPLLPEADSALFDSELYTTQNLKVLTSEFIQEQCFLQLDREVPYGMAVNIRVFEEGLTTKEGKPLTRIAADLVVEKESHRPIVVGAKGQRLKSIGEKARKSTEKMLGTKVYLDLHVKISPGWPNSKQKRKELGYEPESRT